MGCKPKLRFPEFSGEWEKKTLGETLEATLGGGTPSRRKSSYWNGDIPWASVKDLDNNKYKESTVEFITEEGLNNSSSKLIPAESLIISTRMGLGRGFINKKPISINQDLKGLITNDMINIEFLYYWYKLKSDYIETLGKGSTVKGLRLEELHALSFSFPSLEEQQKIVSFLSKVDSKIDLLKKKQELWETYKKGIMQQIFSQKLRFKDENGEDYPDWEEKKLRDICRINKGSQLNKSEMVENGTYYVLNGGMEPSGYTNEWNTPKNTITISEGGNSCGYANFNIENFWCGGHCYALVNLKNIELYFLFQSLKYMEKHLMSLRVGSGLPNIQKKDLQSFRIDIPVRNEQIKIGDLFLGFDIKINLIRKELQITKKFKKGLLQQMFC